MKRLLSDMTLPELAQELHQITSGSQCDFGDDRRGQEIYVLLERRLGDWKPSPPCTLAYDEAVRALCRVAVTDYREKFSA